MPNFIDAFISNMATKGFVKPNRFLVMVEPNIAIARSLGYSPEEIKQRLMVTCASASLPSKSFLTHEEPITHPNRMIPYGINVNNNSGASFEFHVLGDMFEKNIFEMWQNMIIDPQTKQQSFYDDYAKGSTLTVIQIPNIIKSFEGALEALASNGSLSGMRLTEIYPYNFTVNGGSQNYGQSQESMKVKVDFMYHEIYPLREMPFRRSIDDAVRRVDRNGNFTTEQIRETAQSLLTRYQIWTDRNNPFKRNIPTNNTMFQFKEADFVNPNVVDATLQDAHREFSEIQQREAKSALEKEVIRRALVFLAQGQQVFGGF